MDIAQRLAYLLENESISNTQGWTIKKIIKALGREVAGKLEVSLGMLAENKVPFTLTTLNALSQEAGLAINDADSQELIDVIAEYSQSLPEPLRWDAEFVEAIKTLGVKQQPRWVREGYVEEPTYELIASQALATEVASWTELRITRITEAMRAAATEGGATIESVRAAVLSEIE